VFPLSQDQLDNNQLAAVFKEWMNNTNKLIHRLVDDVTDVRQIKKDLFALESRLEIMSGQQTSLLTEMRNLQDDLRDLQRESRTHMTASQDKIEITNLINAAEARVNKLIDILSGDFKKEKETNTKFREKIWLHIGKHAAIFAIALTLIIQVLVYFGKLAWTSFLSSGGPGPQP
jgi:predicted RNase H-like nuclease (RuvC/YqgF family)